MLTANRRHDGLVIDAGVRHQHAEGAQRVDRALLERRHLRCLAEPAIDGEIEPARIGDRRHPNPALGLGRRREAFEKAHPGLAQGFRVGHDVGLRHRHQILGIEELADRDLVGNRPAPRLAELARQHRPLFSGEPHRQAGLR